MKHLFVLLVATLLLPDGASAAFVASPRHSCSTSVPRSLTLLCQSLYPVSGADDDDALPPSIQTIKIDDGGSDLTDRFKYKVQALMGTYDPADASQDTEEASTGNILHAMLHFPTSYSFYVVLGRTPAEDKVPAQAVLDLGREGAGLSDGDASLEAEVTPRGTKFVKVSVAVTVESGAMIAEIYDRLQAMPQSLMQF